MKKLVKKFLIAMLMVWTVTGLSAQCEPDTVDCIDTGLPGEICPRFLPEATLNNDYDESITVLAPASFDIEGVAINVEYIVIDSVRNLPPGISYWANADKFYPDTAYCIQLFGTPTQQGEFQLVIYVTPFVNYLNTVIQGTQVVDDTSVTMLVRGPSGMDLSQAPGFQVRPTVPNPFTESVLLGFYTPADDHIELKVYNILGKMVYEETQRVPPGEHFFNFDGRYLLPGTYFYRITNSGQLHTGKFIKSR